MAKTTTRELSSALEELRSELASLSARIARLEGAGAVVEPPAAAPPAPVTAAAPEAPKVEAAPGISEEELLAISAALAAFLGVRVHIRQIRLISSRAWAQEGRVSIQASHRLHS